MLCDYIIVHIRYVCPFMTCVHILFIKFIFQFQLPWLPQNRCIYHEFNKFTKTLFFELDVKTKQNQIIYFGRFTVIIIYTSSSFGIDICLYLRQNT